MHESQRMFDDVNTPTSSPYYGKSQRAELTQGYCFRGMKKQPASIFQRMAVWFRLL
jgi:hypothetical protein